MTIMDSESITEEFDDEFDLDVRIDDLDPAEPDRIHRAATFGTSCTMCCPGEEGSGIPAETWCHCRTYRGCSDYSECLCTGDPC